MVQLSALLPSRVAARAHSPATTRAYARQWRAFTDWCEASAQLSADPSAVALYLTGMAADSKLATIDQAAAAIRHSLRSSGDAVLGLDETVRRALREVRHLIGVVKQRSAEPATSNHMLAALAVLSPVSLIGLRDRALLLVGFTGAFRRSELVALELRDVTFTTKGLDVVVRRSKTDQQGRGRRVVLAAASDPSCCPERALHAWLDASGVTSGPLFRSVDRHGNVSLRALTAEAVSLIIRRTMARAGFSPKGFSGHSLRVGFVGEARDNGHTDHAIKRQTGHRWAGAISAYDHRNDLGLNASAGILGGAR